MVLSQLLKMNPKNTGLVFFFPFWGSISSEDESKNAGIVFLFLLLGSVSSVEGS